eukprot:6534858-Alexandrium_andersonii.AAC.1
MPLRPPATVNQPVGRRATSLSEDPALATRLVADVDGPTTLLARRPGAHVILDIDSGCANIEIFCED